MKNPASTKAPQGSAVVEKKSWTKPVLDILELENAQHGTSHIIDGNYRHVSG